MQSQYGAGNLFTRGGLGLRGVKEGAMPFKFVDDGYPDADDYSSNYVWVEPEPAERTVAKRVTPAVTPKASSTGEKSRRHRLPWWLGGCVLNRPAG